MSRDLQKKRRSGLPAWQWLFRLAWVTVRFACQDEQLILEVREHPLHFELSHELKARLAHPG